MIRVAFLMNLSENWLGGVNYFRNLLCAIAELPSTQIAPVIFIGKKMNRNLLKGFPNIEIIESEIFDAWSFLWIKRKVGNKVFFEDRNLDQLLKKNKIDIVSHVGGVAGKMKTPLLGWIPDFQHRHLPQLFTDKELSGRNRTFMGLCQGCKGIILSSYNAKKDLEDFAPDLMCKVHVLQFVVQPPTSDEEFTAQQLEQIYGFEGKYIYMPNQFWKHKNHKVLLEALNILKKQKKEILVVATGSTEDYRNPEYYSGLSRFVEEHNLVKNFIVLGKIPYSHVVALAKHCKALINPSLFEGWSTTVEEAKSLGKKMILSDILVHKEQEPPGGIYFNPHNPDKLAEILWNVWVSDESDDLLKIQAKRNLKERNMNFAKAYEKIILDNLK